MSKSKAIDSSGNGHGLLDRARGAVVVAVPAGQRARGGMVSAMRKGLLQARSWTAPQMESFASVIERRITPAVTASLRSSAKKVRPPRESRMRGMTRFMLSWPGLMALFAVLGAGAVAGISMRKRYSNATAEAEKPTTDTTTPVVPEPMGERGAHDDYRIGSGSSSNW